MFINDEEAFAETLKSHDFDTGPIFVLDDETFVTNPSDVIGDTVKAITQSFINDCQSRDAERINMILFTAFNQKISLARAIDKWRQMFKEVGDDSGPAHQY